MQSPGRSVHLGHPRRQVLQDRNDNVKRTVETSENHRLHLGRTKANVHVFSDSTSCVGAHSMSHATRKSVERQSGRAPRKEVPRFRGPRQGANCRKPTKQRVPLTNDSVGKGCTPKTYSFRIISMGMSETTVTNEAHRTNKPNLREGGNQQTSCTTLLAHVVWSVLVQQGMGNSSH